MNEAKNIGLISDDYRKQNLLLHIARPTYGKSGSRWTAVVAKLVKDFDPDTILDYGCGKQTLSLSLPHLNIVDYDPAIPELSQEPLPADLVICTDVLEHIEPEYLENVLDNLKFMTLRNAFFTVATRPAQKKLPDGRNAHLIIEDFEWWKEKLEKRFKIIEEHSVLPGEYAVIVKAK